MSFTQVKSGDPYEVIPDYGRDWVWEKPSKKDLYAMQKDRPRISVVIPSFNQGKFIEKTIRSVLLQNYPNLELILIDGGSTDQSISIIRKFEPWIDFWVSEKDSGQANAINKGLDRATGDVLYWINSDDYLLPNALFYIGSFNWEDDIGAIVGRGHKVDLNDQIRYTPKVPELSYNAFVRWVGYGNFMQPACFFSAKAWKECGPLNEKLHFCLDVDLWIKISQKYKFRKIENDLAHAYIHSNAKTTAEKEKMKIETALLITCYGEFEIARDMLFKLADEYQSLKRDRRNVFRNTLFKVFKRITGRNLA